MTQINHIPSMTPGVVHEYLRKIGRKWTGQGTAMELGSWLGASAVALLGGLIQANYDKVFWCSERWEANEQQVQMTANNVKLKLKQDVRSKFLANVLPVYSRVEAIKGNLPETLSLYNYGPVEICLFDAPKQEPVFTGCVKKLHRYWIPGVTVLGLLDYKFYTRKRGEVREKLLAPVHFMAQYGGCFEQMQEWDPQITSSVFFRYVKKLEL